MSKAAPPYQLKLGVYVKAKITRHVVCAHGKYEGREKTLIKYKP